MIIDFEGNRKLNWADFIIIHLFTKDLYLGGGVFIRQYYLCS